MANMVNFNVRDIVDYDKCQQIFNFLRDSRADIALLQETHSCAKTIKIWRNEWGGQFIASHGASNSRGVAILFRHNAPCKINGVFRDINGRVII